MATTDIQDTTATAAASPMSAGTALVVEGVGHSYGQEMALGGVDLTVEPGEFVTLLGPSGCGKTTLLRIIAGFLRPTEGRVLLGDKDITKLSAHKRPIGMVFQRPTLFPHLNVADNIAFGLKLQRVGKAETKKRVAEALELIGMAGYGARRAHELSGGQMQRVGLARALVRRPQVLLLDEPLSALDLRIRLDMEVELRRVHRETGASFVYVTHDQREALALSDRVAVFNHGRIEQVGTPEEVYRAPRSAFAARFVGDANVFACEVTAGPGSEKCAVVGSRTVQFDGDGSEQDGPGWLIVRPEAVRISPAGSGDAVLTGVVDDLAFRGAGVECRVSLDGGDDVIKAETVAVDFPDVAIGDRVDVGFRSAAVRVLTREAGP